MSTITRAILIVWLIAYPILPISPLIAGAIAIAMGPPLVAGTDANGWPVIERVTPADAAVLVGLPWLAGALLIFAVGRWRGSRHARRHPSPDA